jgi:hypothetical protein
VHVEEGLAVAIVVEETGTLPPPVTATTLEEGRTTVETIAP